ncbi:MAG TPA: hypothetical protein VGM37_01270 [Armatimonadota bacterium]|jgi:hypothetical protein
MSDQNPLLVECPACNDTGRVMLPVRTWFMGGVALGHGDGCECEACQTPAAIAHRPYFREPPAGETSKRTVAECRCRLCDAARLQENIRRYRPAPVEYSLTQRDCRRIGDELRRRGIVPERRRGPEAAVPPDPEELAAAKARNLRAAGYEPGFSAGREARNA